MLREVGAFFVNKTVVVFGFLVASDRAYAEDHQKEGEPEKRLTHENWAAISATRGLSHDSFSIIRFRRDG